MNETVKKTGNSMGWALLQGCLTLVVLGAGYMISLEDVSRKLAAVLPGNTDAAATAVMNLRTFGMPAGAVMVLLIALFTGWGARRASRDAIAGAAAATKKSPRPPKLDPAIREAEDRRLYLHLLSVLQREGRLVDFFSENLDAYEDMQIGAAVRSIQGNCKAAFEKYLSPNPILDSAEGETITVDAGFSPARINLTGNVSGTPPFTGVVRHRGWQAGKVDIPRLSGDTADVAVIAPAEVEVM